jgi:hypothetical protein
VARLLFICGSMNQTTQMHAIARQLLDHDCWFTPFYTDAFLDLCRRLRLLEFTIGGNKLRRRCLDYLAANRLPIDVGGRRGGYDLVVTCSDLVIPRNVRGVPLVLVQEGMTDPDGVATSIVRALPFLPRWLAGTSLTGLSDRYDRFCVASQGYRDRFVARGARPEKLIVTGVPNFDDCDAYRRNDFPYRGYVLCCTSDARETFQREDRAGFLRRAVELAAGRKLLVKLHPNENVDRAAREVAAHAPGAIVLCGGRAEEMVANCDLLVAHRSSLVYVALALGKDVHSSLDLAELRRLQPVQNRAAARNIAAVCRELLGEATVPATMAARLLTGRTS